MPFGLNTTDCSELTKINDDTGLSVIRLQSMFMPHCCVVKSDPEPPSWSYEIPKPHVTPPSAIFEYGVTLVEVMSPSTIRVTFVGEIIVLWFLTNGITEPA